MNRKRIGCFLVLLLLINFAGPVAAQTAVTDVPTDHWAYYAVTNAINKGYLTVFEDGRFKGADPVDRYTLATVINLLLEEMQIAQVKGTTGDIGLIRELSQKFEKDLASWYTEEQAFREELEQTQEHILIAEERVSRVVDAHGALQEQVEELEVLIQILQSDVGEVQLGLGDYSEDIGQNIEDLLNAILLLDKELTAQQEAIESQDKAIHSLENWAGEKGAVFAALQISNETLEEEIQFLKERNQELENDVRSLAVNLRTEGQKIGDLVVALEKLQQELAVTQLELTTLRDDSSNIDELKRQLAADVNAQMNAALIREQRLERQIKEIEEEFSDYRETANKDIKSAKTMAMIGVAVGAIGAVVGMIVGMGQ